MAEELLLSKVKNRPIVAFDLFGKKHRRWLKNFRFRPGIYGVLRRGSKVLVQRHPLLSTFGFPGGGAEIDEPIISALKREYEEETGIKIKVGKILGVGEDFFTDQGIDVHGIFIYFEVEKTGGKLLPEGNSSDTGEVKFMEISKLSRKNCSRAQWEFIKSYKNLQKTKK